MTAYTKLKKTGLNLSRVESAINKRVYSKRESSMAGNLLIKNISKHISISKKESFKTWVFTSQPVRRAGEPRLFCFQRTLDIHRIEEPHVDIFDNHVHPRMANGTKRGKVNSMMPSSPKPARTGTGGGLSWQRRAEKGAKFCVD